MKYLAIILICCGCYLPKKAERQLNKISVYYPELIAKKSAVLFPQVQRIDSIGFVQWRDSLRTIIKEKIDTFKITDSVDCSNIRKELRSAYVFIKGLQDQLDNIPQIYSIVYDSARIFLAQQAIGEQQRKIERINKSRNFFIYYSTCISAILILLLFGFLIRHFFK